MLIAQLTDTHIKNAGRLAYGRVDTAACLKAAVDALRKLDPQPDLVVLTGDLVDVGSAEEYACLQAILAPLPQALVVVPGNHDEREAMRRAFAPAGYFPASGFLQFAIDDYPLRIVGLDTLVPGQGGGELCAERLDWLARTLAERPAAPTLILMHHPPFATGIGHMDRIGLRGREAFARLIEQHPQVQRVLCGHLHRTIHAMVGGRAALTCPSTAHQVALDLREQAPSGFRMEPPGFMLHRWHDGVLVSHVANIGDFAGPYPFFDESGALID